MVGTCSTIWGEEDRVYVICRKARGKETTRKTKTQSVNNIRMDLGELEWGGGWSGSRQGQVESSCECGNEPSGSIRF
jgi:hypothetical protein